MNQKDESKVASHFWTLKISSLAPLANKLLFVFRLSKDLIRGSLGLEALDIAHSRRAAGEGVG